MKRLFLVLIILFLLPVAANAATRLGLHVTQEELDIWRARRTDNTNTINGKTFQFIWTNRILADANTFDNANNAFGDGYWAGWTAGGCAPGNASQGGIFPDKFSGQYYLDAAFTYMIDAATYASKGSEAAGLLLNQTSPSITPGTDFSNTTKWCDTTLISGEMGFKLYVWVIVHLHAYEYLRIGGYPFTGAQITQIEDWFDSLAVRGTTAMVNAWQANTGGNRQYQHIFDTPINYTCTAGADPCSTAAPNQGILYFGGATVYNPTYWLFFNQTHYPWHLAMAWGTYTNNQQLKDWAAAFYKAKIVVGTYGNGEVPDYNRWQDCGANECPASAWGHSWAPVASHAAIADILARTGDTSLYTFSAPLQTIGQSSVTMSLLRTLQEMARLTNKTVVRYGTFTSSEQDSAHQISWDTDTTGARYDHWNLTPFNVFFKDGEMHTAMSHNLAAGEGDTSSDCPDPQKRGCFQGNGMYPDTQYMWGKLDGCPEAGCQTINPFSPTAPPVTITVDSTYSGYSTSVINDETINASGGTATTWASAESSVNPHWIQLDFSSPIAINEATIYWAFNAVQNAYTTSQSVEFQWWTGSAWQTAGTFTRTADVASSTITFTSITADRVRFFQPANQGNPAYPIVLWVTEIDYASTDQVIPSAPTGLTLTAVSSARIDASWTAPTTNTDGSPLTDLAGYRLTFCNGSGCTPATNIDLGIVTSYQHQNLLPGTLYRYLVRAKDASGNFSAPSAVVEKSTLPLPTALVDDFNDNSRDAAKWDIGLLNGTPDTNVVVSETSQQLRITPRTSFAGTAYRGYVSVNTFDLTNNSVSVEVVQATNVATSADTELKVGTASQRYSIAEEGGVLYFCDPIGGCSVSVPYSSTTHRWWRIRHQASDDTIKFDTSSDNSLWTQRRSLTRNMTITAVKFQLSAGTYESVASPGMAIFDNFTYLPTPTIPNPPTNVQVTSLGLHGLQVACTLPTTNIDGSPLTDLQGIRVYRCVSQVCSLTELLQTIPGQSCSYQDNGLVENTYYGYQVAAYSVIESDRSSGIQFAKTNPKSCL